MPSYNLLALTAVLSVRATSALDIKIKRHLRSMENLAEDDPFHSIVAAESISLASTQMNSKSAKSAKPSEIDLLTERFSALEKLVTEQVGHVDALENEVDTLEKEATEQAGHVDALQKEATKQAGHVDALQKEVDTLEKDLDELENLTNIHPFNPSCEENYGRLEELAAGLPDGCSINRSNFNYRLVCDKPGTYSLHLPDMCNATAFLVGGGGSGGSSVERHPAIQLSGGGGAGGALLYNNTSFGDGYYVARVGAGGTSNHKATQGIGGDTTIELKQRLSQNPSEYPGEELIAFGGGRGGGLLAATTREFPCSFPTVGGSGGGGTPRGAVDVCNYGGYQHGGASFAYQGNSGGDAAEFCAGGGGGAGEKGDDGSDGSTVSLVCAEDKGGEGIYVGNIVGTDYGQPGGWFAGGGNPSHSDLDHKKGGGGSKVPWDTDWSSKNGAENTGGGGVGCTGTGQATHQLRRIANRTCIIGDAPGSPDQATNFYTWGSNGGSGILFIVFDLCPCSNN